MGVFSGCEFRNKSSCIVCYTALVPLFWTQTQSSDNISAAFSMQIRYADYERMTRFLWKPQGCWCAWNRTLRLGLASVQCAASTCDRAKYFTTRHACSCHLWLMQLTNSASLCGHPPAFWPDVTGCDRMWKGLEGPEWFRGGVVHPLSVGCSLQRLSMHGTLAAHPDLVDCFDTQMNLTSPPESSAHLSLR